MGYHRLNLWNLPFELPEARIRVTSDFRSTRPVSTFAVNWSIQSTFWTPWKSTVCRDCNVVLPAELTNNRFHPRLVSIRLPIGPNTSPLIVNVMRRHLHAVSLLGVRMILSFKPRMKQTSEVLRETAFDSAELETRSRAVAFQMKTPPVDAGIPKDVGVPPLPSWLVA